MLIPSRYRKEFRSNVLLALPIMAGQLGQVLVNFIDNIMVGKLGAESLAAVSLAIAVYITFHVVGMGISYALSPLVAEADGADETSRVSKLVRHSFIINLIYALVCAVLIQLALPILDHLGQDHRVAQLARPYLAICGWALIPMMIFQTLKCYADGMSETRAPMVASLLGNVCNVVLNYMLIYGNWGAPHMGVSGAALGTLIARWMMIGLLIMILYRHTRLWVLLKESYHSTYSWQMIKKVLALGIPSSLQMFFEVSAFAGAALIMGTLGASPQAAHQIVINLSSTTFLMCTGIGIAASIRVGYFLGRRDAVGIQKAGIASLYLVIIIMTCAGILFIVGRHLWPLLYLSDPDVLEIAAMLLVIAGIFQIPDGVQVVALGALRGLQDVKVPTIITFVAYWIFGLPISYVGAKYLDWGPLGIWIGLLLGLSISASLLTWRFRQISSRWMVPIGPLRD